METQGTDGSGTYCFHLVHWYYADQPYTSWSQGHSHLSRGRRRVDNVYGPVPCKLIWKPHAFQLEILLLMSDRLANPQSCPRSTKCEDRLGRPCISCWSRCLWRSRAIPRIRTAVWSMFGQVRICRVWKELTCSSRSFAASSSLKNRKYPKIEKPSLACTELLICCITAGVRLWPGAPYPWSMKA